MGLILTKVQLFSGNGFNSKTSTITHVDSSCYYCCGTVLQR